MEAEHQHPWLNFPGFETKVLAAPDVEQLAGDVCAICLSPFVVGSLASATPCRHPFHYICLFGHLALHVTCPMCRTQVLDAVVTVPNLHQHFRSIALYMAPTANLQTREAIRRALVGETVVQRDQRNGPQPDQQIPDGQNDATIIVRRDNLGGHKGKGSKAGLLRILETHYGYYVPGQRMAKLDFLRQLLDGSKLLIKKTQVRPVYGEEHFPQLSITNLIAFGRQRVNNFDAYLPDGARAADIERSYLLVLVNSLVPDSVENMRLEALGNANINPHQREHDRAIRLRAEFQDLFSANISGSSRRN